MSVAEVRSDQIGKGGIVYVNKTDYQTADLESLINFLSHVYRHIDVDMPAMDSLSLNEAPESHRIRDELSLKGLLQSMMDTLVPLSTALSVMTERFEK